jgi:proton-dependent oligopeptide transporter, POT family
MIPATDAPQGKMPRQIPYIIGNEACERFSFYGMRNILVPFLISSVLLAYLPDQAAREGAAKDLFHSFVSRYWAAGCLTVTSESTTPSSGSR